MINLQQNFHHNNPTNPLTTIPPTQQTRRSMIPHTDNPGPLIPQTHLDDILALELSDTLINAAYNLSAMKINLAIQKICDLQRMFINHIAQGFESILECSNREYKVGISDRLRQVFVLRQINNNLQQQQQQQQQQKDVIVQKITYPIMLTRQQQQQKLLITVRQRLQKMSRIMAKKHNVKLYEAFISISSSNSSRRNVNEHNNNQAMPKTNNRQIRRQSQQLLQWSQIKSDKNITFEQKLFNKMSKQKPKSKTIISTVMYHKNNNSSSTINRATVTNNHSTNHLNKSMNYIDNSNNNSYNSNNSSNSNTISNSKSITKFNPIRLPKRNTNINTNINSNNNYPQSQQQQLFKQQHNQQLSISNKQTKLKQRQLQSLRSKYNKLVQQFHIFSQRFLSVIKQQQQ